MDIEKWGRFLGILILLLFILIPALIKSAESESFDMSKPQTIHKENRTANHLINESSPYLLQHAYNPVDWYPWSDEALDKAKKEDKPIFLSIGYAACHWCHVMEHESFENEEIAAFLNEHFVSIKVDREQRPDLDQIYMAATMALNRSGGWPMTVFLTPDLKPFFAGTYFPPQDSHGRPGFKNLITQLAQIYTDDRQRVNDFGEELVKALQSSHQPNQSGIELDRSIVEQAATTLMSNYDSVNGGFGGAPKFPHPSDLSFLLKVYAETGNQEYLDAVNHTLEAMAQGGIYDQIGGGFHRYATDSQWLVPHFEKMLYDNGLLAVVYAEAYQVTGSMVYKRIVRETLDFMIREMRDSEGGFYSSLDADSEGEEGRFYVWKKAEIDRLLGDRKDTFNRYYNITDTGNFEHNTNIPNIDEQSAIYFQHSGYDLAKFEKIMSEQRTILFEARSKRIRPGTDDKILTSWNGLAISGLAKGYQITGENKYRDAATAAAEFIMKNMYKDNKLIHSYRDGKTSSGLFLEDYAYLLQGLIDLYESSYDFKWIQFASEMADQAIQIFSDESGNLYLSPENQSDHFIRPRDIADGAIPAPGSILIGALLKLSDITGKREYGSKAEKYLIALSGSMKQMPTATISAIAAYDYMTSEKVELILVGDKDRDSFVPEIYSRYFPNRIIVVSDNGKENIELLEGRETDGTTVAYICRNSVCQLPADNVDELKRQIVEITR